MSEIRFPNVEVKLTGTDGNAFAIIGKVTGAMRRHGIPEKDRNEYVRTMMSAPNYHSLLAQTMDWVKVS